LAALGAAFFAAAFFCAATGSARLSASKLNITFFIMCAPEVKIPVFFSAPVVHGRSV
jgi:hypothetical protein